MRSIEQPPPLPDMPIVPAEKIIPQSWELYLHQLGQQFQVDFSRPGTSLRLSSLDMKHQLAIGAYRTYVGVSHGETVPEGMAPTAEITFDITSGGVLVPSEIRFTDEVWSDFQEKLRKSDQPPTDEQAFDGDRFASYLLNEIAQKRWITPVNS